MDFTITRWGGEEVFAQFGCFENGKLDEGIFRVLRDFETKGLGKTSDNAGN